MSSLKLLAPFFLVCALQVHADVPSQPTLFFEYSWLYDRTCANTPERKIDLAWAQEARLKIPDFTRIWGQSGPTLFGKVFETFGRGFKRKEITATVSVCQAPSYSNPLVLNVNRFLKSYMGARPVRSDESFADLVFHEMLHTWVVENMTWPTPLTTKYRDEERTVTNHLHLMALQKYVYTELGRSDLLKMIDDQYKSMPVTAYNRAWEIVSKIEGYEAFIAEIERN